MIYKDKAGAQMSARGRFFIVNAGPGVRENITLRGYQVLQQADLVIASESQRKRFAQDLQNKEVIDGGHGLFSDMALRRLTPEEAQRQQEALLERLNNAHAAGQTIVLLESGDISLFSPYRGFLQAFAHLQPELIEGVSSFNAANALLGRPLLNKRSQRLQLSGLTAFMEADPACLPDTWVLFCMGLDWPELIDRMQALYPADTQLALVINAGYPEHEVIECRVGELGAWREKEIAFPYCMIYIGLRPLAQACS